MVNNNYIGMYIHDGFIMGAGSRKSNLELVFSWYNTISSLKNNVNTKNNSQNEFRRRSLTTEGFSRYCTESLRIIQHRKQR